MWRFLYLQLLLACPTIDFDSFTSEVFKPWFFPLLGKVRLGLQNSTLAYCDLRNWLWIGLGLSKHIPLCLYTVLCVLSNWQKKNWKLGFQCDNVTVFNENLVLNMWYHVKLFVLGIKSTVEVNITKLICWAEPMGLESTRSQTQCGWYVPHFTYILSLCCSFRIVLVKNV